MRSPCHKKYLIVFRLVNKIIHINMADDYQQFLIETSPIPARPFSGPPSGPPAKLSREP